MASSQRHSLGPKTTEPGYKDPSIRESRVPHGSLWLATKGLSHHPPDSCTVLPGEEDTHSPGNTTLVTASGMTVSSVWLHLLPAKKKEELCLLASLFSPQCIPPALGGPCRLEGCRDLDRKGNFERSHSTLMRNSMGQTRADTCHLTGEMPQDEPTRPAWCT